jgi:hypothetical protein
MNTVIDKPLAKAARACCLGTTIAITESMSMKRQRQRNTQPA